MINNITIAIGLSLVFSLIINGFCIWYIRNLLKRFLFISNNIADLIDMVSNYRAHLKSVYSLDMFYGDETLKALMEHTSLFSELLEDFEDVIEITEPIEQIEMDGEEETQQKENLNGPTQTNKENVFYAGSRRRDT
tara:strand:+ start:403 stop:810 length:408 start_codon:yes stop_codon:yes gene_type:complete